MSETARPVSPVEDPAKGSVSARPRRLLPLIAIGSVIAFVVGMVCFAFAAQAWLSTQKADAMALATPTPGTDNSTDAVSARNWWDKQSDGSLLVSPSPQPTPADVARQAGAAPEVQPSANPMVAILRNPDGAIASAQANAGTGMDVPVSDDASPAPDAATQPAIGATQDSGIVSPPPAILRTVATGFADGAATRTATSERTSTDAADSPGAAPPATPFVLRRYKTTIPCTLSEAINSEHQSYPVCVVSDDVYDSIAYRYLLVPRGTTCTGEWHEAVVDGQTALVAVWKELDFANGWRYDFSGTSLANDGGVGIPARVDNHGRRIFLNGLLLTGIATLATLATGGAGAVIGANGAIRPGAVLGSSILQSTSTLANATIGKSMNLPPSLHVDFGDTMQIAVLSDMPFPSPYPFSTSEAP